MAKTQEKLDELIRLITRQVLKEYSSMMSSDHEDKVDPGTADDGVKPMDAMTSAEKSKMRHDQMLQNKRELDMAKQQQKTNKEKAASYKSQYDQWNRFERQNDDKTVKDLSKRVSSPGIAENIRKLVDD